MPNQNQTSNNNFINMMLVCGIIEDEQELELLKRAKINIFETLNEIKMLIKSNWETWRAPDNKRLESMAYDNLLRLLILYTNYKGHETEEVFISKFLEIAKARSILFKDQLHECIKTCERNSDIFYNLGIIAIKTMPKHKNIETHINKDGSVYFLGGKYKEEDKIGAIILNNQGCEEIKIESIEDEISTLKILLLENKKSGLILLPELNKMVVLSRINKDLKGLSNIEYINFLYHIGVIETRTIRILIKQNLTESKDFKDTIYHIIMHNNKKNAHKLLRGMRCEVEGSRSVKGNG